MLRRLPVLREGRLNENDTRILNLGILMAKLIFMIEGEGE
jgi:hypothetical protein